MSYDVLYQDWLAAKRSRDFELADKLRGDFERSHGLTIFAEGIMPVEGVTVRRMRASDWQKKYGNPKVGATIAQQDSKVTQEYPDYKGLPDSGYHDR